MEDIYDRNHTHLTILNETMKIIQKQNTLASTVVHNEKNLNLEELRKLEEQVSINLNTVSYNLYYDLPPQQLTTGS